MQTIRPTLHPPSALGRLARFAFRKRGTVVLGWLAAFVLVFGLSQAFGGSFTSDYSAPGSDSQKAQRLLEERFPGQADAFVTVAIHAEGGVAAVRGEVTDTLRELGTVRHVTGADDPYTAPGGVSQDGRTLIALLRLDMTNADKMPVEDGQRLIDISKENTTAEMKVSLGGQAIMKAEGGAIGSEGIGLVAAAFILLLTFGSVVAAGLPLLVAVIGLAVSTSLTGLLILLMDAPEWSTSLAAMMGIGIGIDYVLLMVTRFREWRSAGLDPEAATVATLDTAGRSVLVAGSTVIVSMLGLFSMGLASMRGAALVTMGSVLVVLLASMTLFPALMGYLGRHIDRLRLPIGRRRPTSVVSADGHVVPSRGWQRWSHLVQRHRIAATLVSVAALVALAVPFFDVRFGIPDAGNNRTETSTRQAYDTISDGFGPGSNAPLSVAVRLPQTGQAAEITRLSAALSDAPGIASVSPPRFNPARDTAVINVTPDTGPQDARTEDVVHVLRDTTIPRAVEGTEIRAHVGGATAVNLDSATHLAGRIPYLVGGVLALSMLVLLVSFRSIAVMLKAAVMNLLSVAAAYGVVAVVLQGGWAGQLVGIDTPTPLPPFVPVMMFAVLFGLSMDYEVFLVSRMRESWIRTGDTKRAVTDGLAGTGRVITAAAAIMIAVFAAFVPSTEVILKVLGVGMASAILLDATLVRMLLVPAAMHLMGRFNWWLPQWLGRRLPELHIEGRPERHLPVARQKLAAEQTTARRITSDASPV
ncbi:MMPL family transporter [Streptomyces sp. NPDC059568]|uniref:MMPL family transporter n=1 Tax=Streptomyces sp. NPDC059568 TaxID=3346868 RepID=UPI0036969F2C